MQKITFIAYKTQTNTIITTKNKTMKTTYKQAKEQLNRIAKQAKEVHTDDKPMIRQLINDTCDYLCKEYRFTDYQRNLLSNYCCKLHPED